MGYHKGSDDEYYSADGQPLKQFFAVGNKRREQERKRLDIGIGTKIGFCVSLLLPAIFPGPESHDHRCYRLQTEVYDAIRISQKREAEKAEVQSMVSYSSSSSYGGETGSPVLTKRDIANAIASDAFKKGMGAGLSFDDARRFSEGAKQGSMEEMASW